MKNDRRKRDLLADILAEESDPSLRDVVFGQTLCLVRRRNRFRAVRRAGSLALLIMFSSLLAHHLRSPRSFSLIQPKPRPESGYALIRTQPAAPTMTVSTQPFPPARVVASVSAAHVIATKDFPPVFVELTDDQLLDLTKGAPVALVRLGPHQAELVFVNEDDREKLFRN